MPPSWRCYRRIAATPARWPRSTVLTRIVILWRLQIQKGVKMALQIKKSRETHGMKSTPEYAAWQRMRRRCHDPENKDYPEYGAMGITVCPEWQISFVAFH